MAKFRLTIPIEFEVTDTPEARIQANSILYRIGGAIFDAAGVNVSEVAKLQQIFTNSPPKGVKFLTRDYDRDG